MDENVKTVNCTDVQYGFFMFEMQYIWKKIVLKTAQSVFYPRNNVLTMLLFLGKRFMWSATKIIICSCVLKRIFVIHNWESLGFCQLEETTKPPQKTRGLSSVPQIVKNLELQSFILNCTNKTFDPLPTFENCLQPWSLVSTLQQLSLILICKNTRDINVGCCI